MGNLVFVSFCLLLAVLVMARTGDSTPAGNYEVISGNNHSKKTSFHTNAFFIYFLFLFILTLAFFFFAMNQSKEFVASIDGGTNRNPIELLFILIVTPVFLMYYFVFYLGLILFLTLTSWFLFFLNRGEKSSSIFKSIFICNIAYLGLGFIYLLFIFFLVPN
ncbi:MAG: hypothetical protein R2799_05895 [Crocinitomicaceae bacterium]